MPNNVSQVSFMNPYQGDLSEIDRQKALAQALQTQGMEPLQTNRMAGNVAVPISPLEGFAKLAQSAVGGYAQKKATDRERDLYTKSQGDYQRVLSQALSQMQTDPAGAMATLSQHPAGQNFIPLAMQEYQRQQLLKALRGGQQPQQPPMEGQGTVLAPGMGGQPPQGMPAQGQPPSGLGGPAGGVPLEAWLASDPSGKSYLNQTAEQNQALGGVQYDQSGKAFVTTKGGGVQYLPGISARDKNEMVDTGAAITPTNPYTGEQGAPIPKGFTPAQGVQLPIEQQQAALKGAQFTYETGQPAPALPPLPGSASPSIAPRQLPQGERPLPGAVNRMPIPQAGGAQIPLTPKNQAELNMERAKAQPKALVNLQSAQTKATTALGKVDEVMKGLESGMTSGATGSVLGSVPGTKAHDVRKNIETLQNILSIKELQDMRAASQTGGAVGSVTEGEWDKLANVVASLSQSQNKEQLTKNLAQIKAHFEKWKGAMEQSYSSQYGSPTIGAPSSQTLNWEDLK